MIYFIIHTLSELHDVSLLLHQSIYTFQNMSDYNISSSSVQED